MKRKTVAVSELFDTEELVSSLQMLSSKRPKLKIEGPSATNSKLKLKLKPKVKPSKQLAEFMHDQKHIKIENIRVVQQSPSGPTQGQPQGGRQGVSVSTGVRGQGGRGQSKKSSNGSCPRWRSWPHIEEVFLIGAVMERFFRRGSLSSSKKKEEGEHCWTSIKKIYDHAWKIHLRLTDNADASVYLFRSSNALARHYKVMKERIMHNQYPQNRDFRQFYQEWETKYNKNNVLLTGCKEVVSLSSCTPGANKAIHCRYDEDEPEFPKSRWSYEEEVFLVAAVLERFFKRGSLASTRMDIGNNECWSNIKQTYDYIKDKYQELHGSKCVGTFAHISRSSRALTRHFKVMKVRFTESNGYDNLKKYFMDWQAKYNEGGRILTRDGRRLPLDPNRKCTGHHHRNEQNTSGRLQNPKGKQVLQQQQQNQQAQVVRPMQPEQPQSQQVRPVPPVHQPVQQSPQQVRQVQPVQQLQPNCVSPGGVLQTIQNVQNVQNMQTNAAPPLALQTLNLFSPIPQAQCQVQPQQHQVQGVVNQSPNQTQWFLSTQPQGLSVFPFQTLQVPQVQFQPTLQMNVEQPGQQHLSNPVKLVNVGPATTNQPVYNLSNLNTLASILNSAQAN